jgi:hypothetical protein
MENEKSKLATQFIENILQSGTIIHIEKWNDDRNKGDLYFIKNMITPVEGNAKSDVFRTRANLYFTKNKRSTNAYSILSFFVKECEDLPEKLWSKQEFQVIGEKNETKVPAKVITLTKVLCTTKNDVKDYCDTVTKYANRKLRDEVDLPDDITQERTVMDFHSREALFDNYTKYFLDMIGHCLVWGYDGSDKEIPRLLGVVVHLNEEVLEEHIEKKKKQWADIVKGLTEITEAQMIAVEERLQKMKVAKE